MGQGKFASSQISTFGTAVETAAGQREAAEAAERCITACGLPPVIKRGVNLEIHPPFVLRLTGHTA